MGIQVLSVEGAGKRRTEVRVILIDNVKENYSCNIIGFSPSHFSPFT
jgi:hypothetical protein